MTLKLEPKLNTSSVQKTNIAANKSTTSEALFAGARALVIEHAGEKYRLSITNQGKLILTK